MLATVFRAARRGAHCAVKLALLQPQRLQRAELVRERINIDALGCDGQAWHDGGGRGDGGEGGAAGEVQRHRGRRRMSQQVVGQHIEYRWTCQAARSHLALAL